MAEEGAGREGRGDLHKPEQDGSRYGGKAEEDDPGNDLAALFKDGTHLGRGDAERLEEAGDAVAEVHAEQTDSDDVKNAHQRAGESSHDHPVNVPVAPGINPSPILWIKALPGELGQMVEDEGENNQSGETHGASEDGGLKGILHRILLGARGEILPPERDGEPDMKHHTGKQDPANKPEQLTKVLEEMRVAVHRVGPQEDGKIPDQMPDHKEDEDDTGDCDDPLAPDRGGKKGPTANAGFFLGRDRATHEHPSIIGMIFRHKRHDLFCRKKLSLGF